MKIKFGLIAAAAVLGFTSLSASATINVSATPDLLFIAYDPLTGDTYTRDLGVSLSALSTNATFNAPTNSIFASQFATATNPIQWNVVAIDNVAGAQMSWTTGSAAALQGLGNGDVLGVTGSETAQLGGFTQLDNPANGYAKANGEYTGSQNQTDVTNAYTIATTLGYGLPVSGNGVGTSQNFIQVANDGTATQLYLNSQLSAFDGNAAGGYFTLVDAAGDLKWTNSVAAVPLPAAAFLFFPGLLAMFGIGRRRQQAAA